MTQHNEQMHLGAVIMATGNHVGGWRHPHARADGGHDLAFFQHLARSAEQARFDLLFFADSVGIRERGGPQSLRRSHHIAQLEPLTLLSALAVGTERIGLVATASTTYNEPYHIARKFASLDHISQGRAGWNAVTSFTDSEAVNFNREKHLAHDLRYARAEEFIAVVKGLWDSWDDDAFVRDKAEGIYVDTERLHYLHHRGEHFSVRGPLNVERTPQGHPVLFQAGASEDGQRLAARTADVVFSAADTLEQAVAFRRGLQRQVAEQGRDPLRVKVMPGVFVIVGETEEAAWQRSRELDALVHEDIGMAQLNSMIGVDLSAYPLGGPLPTLAHTQGHQSRQRLLLEKARREGLSIRQLYQLVANAFGHKILIGAPEQIADGLQQWFEAGAADGFNIMAPFFPGAFDDFARLVVPILQGRGLFRREYQGKTLRDHLGLERVQSRYANT
ncbi:LLM class flavin-dependent oxidoreductase [Pseudomonas typographi]|uniref:LLM class flavin-dependent oxidoreductase n=1 Tax=Pseudomonas typographi TaxID=2715964 RepID=A0ABR7Z8L2_9PSED|nr:LLM class flavin-dependent oxidoreductase [Pseudomonas typographi]MBD1552054.1 LLM class flavin-dependent oxidoreductase [Pseudomonas typographi]MBD1586618.1 LLM class flavin-dependent oxidoreductase [Pseudomonas typographi]MBD1601770.1 LLM class flavin-dependent oxidoreductase [Pseudomonas typographi]